MMIIGIRKGLLFIRGREYSGRYHSHIPHQIILSPQKTVSCSIQGGGPAESCALLIPGHAVHYCRLETDALSLFVEPETGRGRALAALTGDRKPADIEGIIPATLWNRIVRFMEGPFPGISAAWELVEDILCMLTGEIHPSPIDPRIAAALKILDSVPDRKIRAADLASRVALSESRFSHLFNDGLGLPLRKYLVWKRLMDALFLVREGYPLTRAAMDAGFADFAHFSRTFKSTFGVNLKSIFKDSRIIHVFVDGKP